MAKRPKNIINGWVNLDKPQGLTSTQAIGKVRKIMGAGKAGHAGTLDPLATGILPIALGEATKTIPYIQDSIKTYEFTITWGAATDTDDSEGQTIATSDKIPSEDEITSALPAFTGKIEQIPPKFSAIKIDGERAYDLARDGQDFEIKSRPVYIESLEMLPPVASLLPPANGGIKGGGSTTDFRMICGKGTYVRSLARDLAGKLGTYGHISVLRRTKTGPFTEKNAISLDKLEELRDKDALDTVLLPLEMALDDILAFSIKQEEAAALRNGQVLSLVSRQDFERLEAIKAKNGSEILVTLDGKPVALTRFQSPTLKPVRVFNM